MSRSRRSRAPMALACLLAFALAGGCSFGPRLLERTHGRYTEAVRHVYEEQLLQSIVHIRYLESPLSLNVQSLTAQYELSVGAEARPFFSTESNSSAFRTFSRLLPFAATGVSNRPTIALLPEDDGDAVQRLLVRIPTNTLVFLAQSGWPVSTVLRLWVDRLNGVPNAVPASGPERNIGIDFERFQRVAALFQLAQDRELMALQSEERLVEVSGPLPATAMTAAAMVEAAKANLEYRPRGEDGKEWVVVRRERKLVFEAPPGVECGPELLELAELLALRPGERRYDLVTGTPNLPDPRKHPRPPGTEVRATLRSTAQVLFYLANGVEVPPEDVEAGVVAPLRGADGCPLDGRRITCGLFTVHCARGHCPPPEAYVAVRHRGHWFYLDDRDRASKATFVLMLQLSRLDLRKQRLGGGGPLLTLSVGR